MVKSLVTRLGEFLDELKLKNSQKKHLNLVTELNKKNKFEFKNCLDDVDAKVTQALDLSQCLNRIIFSLNMEELVAVNENQNEKLVDSYNEFIRNVTNYCSIVWNLFMEILSHQETNADVALISKSIYTVIKLWFLVSRIEKLIGHLMAYAGDIYDYKCKIEIVIALQIRTCSQCLSLIDALGPIREEFRKNFSEALNPYSYQIKFRFFIQLFQLIKSNVYEPSEEFLVETCLEMLIHRSDDLMENSELDKKEEESNENSWNIYLTLTGKPKNREFFNFYVIRFIEKNRRLKKNETEVLVKMDYLHALVCWTKSDLNGAKNFIRRSFDRLKSDKAKENIRKVEKLIEIQAEEIANSYLPKGLLNNKTPECKKSSKKSKKKKSPKKKFFNKTPENDSMSQASKKPIPASKSIVSATPSKIESNTHGTPKSINKTCKQNGSEISTKPINWTKTNWTLVSINDSFEAYAKGAKVAKLFKIRKFPNNLTGDSFYQICDKTNCNQQCTYAHNKLEKSIWDFMKSHSIKSLKKLYELSSAAKVLDLKVDWSLVQTNNKTRSNAHAYYLNNPKEIFEIRKFQNNILGNVQYELCRFYENTTHLSIKAGCPFAHNQLEADIWNFMKANSVKSIQDLNKISVQSVKQTEEPLMKSKPPIKSISVSLEEQIVARTANYYYTNYCRICGQKFENSNAFFLHRLSVKHLQVLQICRRTKFLVRLPPSLLNFKDTDLKECAGIDNGKCAFIDKDTYDNFCPNTHHPLEMVEWKEFTRINSEQNLFDSVNDDLELEDLLIVSKTTRLKKMISFYASDTYSGDQLANWYTRQIHECSYDTLWHKFIHNEMLSCIDLVERFEWICQVNSQECINNVYIYTVTLEYMKPSFVANHDQIRPQLMNLNNDRLSQYISILKVVDESSGHCHKLDIQNKIFNETSQAYQFNLCVRKIDGVGQLRALTPGCQYRGFLMIDRSMFHMMHFAVDNANKSYLFPKLTNYNIAIQEDLDVEDDASQFPKVLTSKQKMLIKRILNVKRGELTPPLIVYGAFGTGKTKCLAMAAEHISKRPNHKVLICTYSESAASTFFNNWSSDTKSKALRLVKSTTDISYQINRDSYPTAAVSPMTKELLKKISDARLVVTTFYLSTLLNECEKIGQWFTHIFIDESSYALECEVIMPLTLATSKTTVILVGDHKQLQPSVVNRENMYFLHENSHFLERVLYMLKGISEVRKEHQIGNYFLMLNEVHRSVREVVEFISGNFYNGKLLAARDYADYEGLKYYYPIQFVELDEGNSETYNYDFSSFQNIYEANLIIWFVQNLINNWPNSWADISIGIICNQNAQINLLRTRLASSAFTKYLKNKSIVVDSIEKIQGLQFRVTLISTVFTSYQQKLEENVLHNYVISPFAANTCLTRCEECLVVFGKQSFLLNVPEYYIPISMQLLWKNLVSLTLRKGTFFKTRFMHETNLYFDELEYKVVERIKGKSKRPIDQDICRSTQYTDDYILNELTTLVTNETLNQHKTLSDSYINVLTDSDDSDDCDTQTDMILSRRDKKISLGKSRRGTASSFLKGFDLEEKYSNARRRLLISAENAGSDMKDEDIDFDEPQHVLRKSTDSDDVDTNGLKRAYYKYVKKDYALRLVNAEPKKYKRCIIEYEMIDTAQAICPDDNTVYILNNRYNCGTSYSGDECIIEVLPNDTHTPKAYARVICILKRCESIKYRRFICNPDPYEPYSIMKPLDNQYTKINIVPNSPKKILLYDIDEEQDECTFVRSETLPNILDLSTQLYLVILLDWHPRIKYPRGVITQVLDPAINVSSGINLLNVMYHLNPTGYASHESELAKIRNDLNSRITRQVNNKERADLTSVLTFTIDPEMSTDLDDAISFEKFTINGRKYYKIGIHIADVSEYLEKNGKVDIEARKRGMTFYHQCKPHCSMLPDSFANKMISLLPNKKRPALSLLFLMNEKAEFCSSPEAQTKAGLEVNFQGRFQITTTLIRSQHKLNYSQAEKCINGLGENSILNESCSILFQLSEELKRKRYLNGHLILDEDKKIHDFKSHSLIEQFMILTNNLIGEYLVTNNISLHRTQVPPDLIRLNTWNTTNQHLLPISFGVQKALHCSRRFIPNFDEDTYPSDQTSLTKFTTLKDNYKSLTKACKQLATDPNASTTELEFLIRYEFNYPATAVAIKSLRTLSKHANYVSIALQDETLNENSLAHFDLNLTNYTHFTSPIRRYFDLVVHRLVKASLKNQNKLDYTQMELSAISNECNTRLRSSKKFEEKLKSLALVEELDVAGVRCLTYVLAVNDNGLRLMHPLVVADVNYAILSVYGQPKMVSQLMRAGSDGDEKCFGTCVLNWSLQVFDAKYKKDETKNSSLSKSNKRINLQNKFTASIPADLWAQIHEAVEKNPSLLIDHAKRMPDIKNTKPIGYQTELKANSNGTIDRQHFFIEYKPNDVVCIQLSSATNNGFREPIIQLVQITDSIDFCIEHKRDPLRCYGARANKPVKNIGQKYENIREYLDIWLPLLYMETTQNSISNSEENFLVQNCQVTWFKSEACHPVNKYKETLLYGKVIINQKCFNMECIESSENYLAGQFGNKFGHPTFVLAYACLQYKGLKAPSRSKMINDCSISTSDKYTWVGHCVVTLIDDKTPAPDKSDNKFLTVYLCFRSDSKQVPVDLYDNICSIEIMRKTYPDSVQETSLRSLIVESKKITPLCERIVLGDVMNEHDKTGFDDKKFEGYLTECLETSKIELNRPNKMQYEAMMRAFSQDFSLIQGPPGTGKTITGVILAHLFFQHNKETFQKCANSSKKIILYVSASNRAVDVFGNYLLKRFHLANVDTRVEIDSDRCISAIRIYSQQIQNNDYPNPNFFNKLKSPSRLCVDSVSINTEDNDNEYDTIHTGESLKAIALHHVIRTKGKPFADDLLQIDRKLSIRREYEDRVRNRLCCCGNRINKFRVYNSLVCDHGRYFKHANSSLSMPNLISKDDRIKEYETKFLFMKLISLRHKKLKGLASEDDEKTLKNVFSNFNGIAQENLLDSYLDCLKLNKKISENNKSYEFMDALELFLGSLEQTDIDRQIWSINRVVGYQISNGKPKRDDLNYLVKNYSYGNASSSFNDLMARQNAKNETRKKRAQLESLEKFLKQAVMVKWQDILQYEMNLHEIEMKLFNENVNENFNDMQTESMCREYNDLLEKACTKEVKRHDIILSTCIASHMKAISEVNIEQLIVDEAAMIKEPEVLVPIISCQPARVVLIGDHKQLRCITKCSQAAEMDFDRSLFERFHRNLTMLEEQYRMHPSICKFPSKAFYKAQLVTGANGPFRTPLFWPKRFQDEQEFLRMERGKGKGYDRDEFRAFRIVFLDVKGSENKLSVSSWKGGEKSVRNDEEIKCTEQLFNILLSKNIEKKDIKILSPYKSQVVGMASAMKLNDSNVSTVITSQGGEWNYVILSTVRTLPKEEINQKPTIGWRKKHLGFLIDEHQVNVALTRAKRGLFIIGDKELLVTHPVWFELIKYLDSAVMKSKDYFKKC